MTVLKKVALRYVPLSHIIACIYLKQLCFDVVSEKTNKCSGKETRNGTANDMGATLQPQ